MSSSFKMRSKWEHPRYGDVVITLSFEDDVNATKAYDALCGGLCEELDDIIFKKIYEKLVSDTVVWETNNG